MGLLVQAPGATNAQKPTAARRAPWAKPRAKTGDQRSPEKDIDFVGGMAEQQE
jgi:hypothetical protein